jgi:hypothetical protein
MKWLTIAEINKAARKSLKAALACACEHWRQLSEATPKELLAGLRSGRVGIDASYCALCIRHGYVTAGSYTNDGMECLRCSENVSWHKCFPRWRPARRALSAWERSPSSDNWKEWKKAAREMYLYVQHPKEK